MSDVAFNTDVMVYASLPAFAEHEPCRRAVHDQLASGRIVLPVGVCTEWIERVTDSKRFRPPAPRPAAVASVKAFIANPRVGVLVVDEAVVQGMFELVERYPGLGLAEGMLLASLRAAGIRRFVTCSVCDFAQFDFLDVVDPTKAPVVADRRQLR